MKKIYLLFTIFLFFGINAFGQSDYTLSDIISIPDYDFMRYADVMNNINVAVWKGNDYETKTINLDSFPVFPGYPVRISGSSFEGIIFCNMDSDPELEIVVNIGYTVQAFNLNGTNVTGWPKTVSSYPLEGAPAFGDIDGDGQGEIIVTNRGTTSGGYIYAYKKNGTTVSGFPVNHGYSSRTPVLADIDNDGKMEIITNKRIYPKGEVWIYKGNGTVYPGWPQSMDHVPASSSAVGDINGDNIPEIVAESYTSLFVWKPNGDSVSGFPYTLPNSAVNSYSSPVLADLDNDGKREIIFGTHVLGDGGYVFILKYDGSSFPNWPKYINNWTYTPPSVGYIDGDNLLDISVGDQILSATPMDQVYAWNKNGQVLSGFPITSLNAINSHILIADIDNDNMSEIIFDDNSTSQGLGKYLAYNHNGTPVIGWPINTTGTTFFITPCITDVNRDGILDIVGGGTESNQSYTNIYLWNTGKNYTPAKIQLPMFQYNERHDGVYNKPAIVGIENFPAPVITDYKLLQNYPNPFNSMTNIKFEIPSDDFASLKIFDLLGREIETLVNEKLPAGAYEIKWNASQFPSGIYFYKLSSGNYVETKCMVLIK